MGRLEARGSDIDNTTSNLTTSIMSSDKEKKDGQKKSGVLKFPKLKRKKQKEHLEPVTEIDSSSWELSDFQRKVTVGTGTFGRVYLVRHKTTKQYYALKVLKKSLVVKLKQVQHVNNEKSLLFDCAECPFVVKLHKHFKDRKNLYLIFDYAVGGELFSYLRASGRFKQETARFYAAEIVLAFEFLHSKHIIYRDLKPENILIDKTGHLLLTDFGFAKRVEDNRTFTLCGTPEYLAPEVIKGKGHGNEVDWWALGVLIFEMLAGYPPFFDENPFGIYEKILLGRIPFPSHIDASSRDLIKKLLTHDRTRRFGNLKDGVNDIKRHRFFKTVDWDALAAKRVKPPMVPKVDREGDTQNFDEYDEESGYEACDDPNVPDVYEAVFADF